MIDCCYYSCYCSLAVLYLFWNILDFELRICSLFGENQMFFWDKESVLWDKNIVVVLHRDWLPQLGFYNWLNSNLFVCSLTQTLKFINHSQFIFIYHLKFPSIDLISTSHINLMLVVFSVLSIFIYIFSNYVVSSQNCLTEIPHRNPSS